MNVRPKLKQPSHQFQPVVVSRQVEKTSFVELTILAVDPSSKNRWFTQRIRTETNNEALGRLESTEDEIVCLKSKVSMMSEANLKSTDDLDAANTETEKLRTLRTEDQKELEMVRSQMERVGEQYRAVLLGI
jgi:hypothetical protein